MCLLLHQSSSSDLCLCLWPPSRSLPSSLCSTTSSRSDWTPRSSSQSCGGRWPCAPKTSVRCGGAGAPIQENVAALERPGYVGVEPPLVLDCLAAQFPFRIEPVRRSPGLSAGGSGCSSENQFELSQFGPFLCAVCRDLVQHPERDGEILSHHKRKCDANGRILHNGR